MGDSPDDRITELEAELAVRVAEFAKQAEENAKQAEEIAKQAEEIAALKEQVAKLLAKLNENSSNSNKPPSSDKPGNRKERRAKAKAKRKRGAKKGHKGSRRTLLSPEQVDEFVDHFPSDCEDCHRALPEVPDSNATRYQVTEIPPITPHTTEHRRHAVTCPHCNFVTRADYAKAKIPASPIGSRLAALIAMLTGVYHLSRRKAQRLLRDVLGVDISLGGISNVEARVSQAVESAVAEAWERAHEGAVKHTDGTGWLQEGVTLSLWTIATTAVTVFKILANGRGPTLKPEFGSLEGILVSDRATALNFWAMGRRQICWAHLLRKCVSFSERAGPAGTFGKELLDFVGLIFEYWHGFKDGKLSRRQLVSRMAPVREQVEALLARIVAADIKGMSGSCANMLTYKQALWTFVDRDGVEPTNNHAERELRGFVLWRKRSFGTQSKRGNRFAERLMTIAHTARKQAVDVLPFLTAWCDPEANSPSLFAPPAST